MSRERKYSCPTTNLYHASIDLHNGVSILYETSGREHSGTLEIFFFDNNGN